MEIVKGRKTRHLDSAAFGREVSMYAEVWVDLGTGDGRYVRSLAQKNPDLLCLGVDACRENMAEQSAKAPKNALFIAASAQSLPLELAGVADHLSINFPWGSLLTGLLPGDEVVMTQLTQILRPQASLALRLNEGALLEAGWGLEEGARAIRDQFRAVGIWLAQPRALSLQELRELPSSWAKRIAFGRYPRALVLQGGEAEGQQMVI